MCIGPRAKRPTRTLAASVLPLVSHHEYMLAETDIIFIDRQTDRQTDGHHNDALLLPLDAAKRNDFIYEVNIRRFFEEKY